MVRLRGELMSGHGVLIVLVRRHWRMALQICVSHTFVHCGRIGRACRDEKIVARCRHFLKEGRWSFVVERARRCRVFLMLLRQMSL